MSPLRTKRKKRNIKTGLLQKEKREASGRKLISEKVGIQVQAFLEGGRKGRKKNPSTLLTL